MAGERNKAPRKRSLRRVGMSDFRQDWLIEVSQERREEARKAIEEKEAARREGNSPLRSRGEQP